jgi:hypothetical protein
MPSVSSINKAFLIVAFACLAAACGDNKKAAKSTGPHTIVPEEAIDIVSMLSEPSQDPTNKLSAKVKGKLSAPIHHMPSFRGPCTSTFITIRCR